MTSNLERSTWKQKAIKRRKAVKELNKRRKELYMSREKWKDKYKAQKQRSDFLEKELTDIKKKLTEMIKR